MTSLLEAVRAACSPTAWSRGVERARAGAVSLEPSPEDEPVLRVVERGQRRSLLVTLAPDELDWHCDGPRCEDGCEHVAAAAIALEQARRGGATLERGAARSHVGYRLRRSRAGLHFERTLVTGRDEQPLAMGLVAARDADRLPPDFAPRAEDLEIERALGPERFGVFPAAKLARLAPLLARCPDVRLDGAPVRVVATPLVPRVVVTDHERGFRVELAEPDAVDERFANGIARCGDALRPLAQAPLTRRELDELGAGRLVLFADVAALVTEILPGLRERLPVDVQARRLPLPRPVAPTLRVEVARDGTTLSVLPTLVYGDPPLARIDGDRLTLLGDAVPQRDRAAEQRLRRRLEAELGLAPGHRAEADGEDAVDLAARLRDWDGGEVVGRALAWFERAAPLRAVPRLTPELELEFVPETDPDEAAPRRRVPGAAVLAAWRAGQTSVPLPGGGWAPLPADWLERHGRQVADLLAARDAAGGTVPASALPELARLCEELDVPPPPDAARLRERLERFERLPAAPLPADLTARLRDYQRRGVDWLVFLRESGLGGVLADDMGLGKTLQALCAVRGRTLVVCPTSVLQNWADEIARFRPALRVATYHGAGRALDPDADVTLTTYALLRLDVDVLAAVSWDTVVLDEAQAIKNPASQVARAACRLRAPFRVTLTGTPVENRLDELWSQMRFTNPGLLGDLTHFQSAYARPIADGDGARAAALHRRLRPFVLRRRKGDVALELPPRTEMVLRCELDADERRAYDAVLAATRDEVVAKLARGANALAVFEALLRLRQTACHRDLVPGQQAERSSKVDLLLEELDQVVADGHKALVFSQWTSLLDRVEPHLARAGIAWTRLDGSTRDRAGVVARFQDEAGPPVFLVSLKAGGTGLNLTAADHVFLLDPWWNPAVEAQAADRAHRIGQTKPVMIYRLIAADTVEERVLALQEHKRHLAETALAGAAGAAALTREDLMALVG